jgi:hypothetical protein
MSNYPLGVTGNELEIAGPDWEAEVERTCTQTDVTLHVITSEGIADITLYQRIDPDNVITPEQILARCVEVEVPECPGIEMEVDAWGYGCITHWACPVCGHDYEESQ